MHARLCVVRGRVCLTLPAATQPWAGSQPIPTLVPMDASARGPRLCCVVVLTPSFFLSHPPKTTGWPPLLCLLIHMCWAQLRHFLKKNLKMLKTSDCDAGRWSESAKVVTVCEAYSSCHTLVHPKWMHLSGPSAGGDGGQAGSCCRLSINSRKRSCLAHFLGACMLGSMGVASLSLARKVSEKLLS